MALDRPALHKKLEDELDHLEAEKTRLEVALRALQDNIDRKQVEVMSLGVSLESFD